MFSLSNVSKNTRITDIFSSTFNKKTYLGYFPPSVFHVTIYVTTPIYIFEAALQICLKNNFPKHIFSRHL